MHETYIVQNPSTFAIFKLYTFDHVCIVRFLLISLPCFFYTAWTYIYIYTVDARTSSRLNEERRKGRKKGGNEDEEGSLSKKLTVYKKYAKESFCVATKRTVRVVIARDTEEAERRGRFSFRQRITQFRGSNWVVCVFEISLFSALRVLYLKEKEKPIDIPNSFCLSIRLIPYPLYPATLYAFFVFDAHRFPVILRDTQV